MAIRVKKKFVSASEPSKTWSSVADFKTAMNMTDDSPLKNLASKQSKATEWFIEDGFVHAYVFYASTDDLNAAVSAYQTKITNDSINRAYTMYTLSTEEV